MLGIQSLSVPTLLKYVLVTGIFLIPIYAIQIFYFYLETPYEVTALQSIYISLQDIAIWLLLGIFVILFLSRYRIDLVSLKDLVVIITVGLVLVSVHTLLDAIANLGLSRLSGDVFTFRGFVVDVGIGKSFQYGLTILTFILYLWVKTQVDLNVDSNVDLNKNEDIRPIENSPSPSVCSDMTRDFLWMKERGRTTRIEFTDIDFIESAGNYCCIHFLGNTILHRHSLSSMQNLVPTHFVRVHRSTIVNTEKIRKFSPKSHGDGELELLNKSVVKVSRRFRKNLDYSLKQLALQSDPAGPN